MKSTTTGRKKSRRPFLLGLGVGIASVVAVTPAHASTPNVGCTVAPLTTPVALSDEEVARRISTLRQVGLDSLSEKVRSLLGPNRLESSCFGQMTGGGGCTYSQEPGCNYTQNCGGGGGTKAALES